MSQELLEGRVGEVEREQARQGERLGRIESDVGKIGTGVERLLERDAKRPQALSWGTIAATAGGLIGVAAVGWWLIGTSPAVQDLRERIADVKAALDRRVDTVEKDVTRLNDPEIGRVPALERKVRELDQWTPRVTRY
jgi:hypothetical protein